MKRMSFIIILATLPRHKFNNIISSSCHHLIIIQTSYKSFIHHKTTVKQQNNRNGKKTISSQASQTSQGHHIQHTLNRLTGKFNKLIIIQKALFTSDIHQLAVNITLKYTKYYKLGSPSTGLIDTIHKVIVIHKCNLT